MEPGVHSASLTSLCGISSYFVFVNTALQFNSAVPWIEPLLGGSTLTCVFLSSCRLADCHPGAAGGRCCGNPGGLFGGPDFPLPGDTETALPHRGCFSLHCRYVSLYSFLLLLQQKFLKHLHFSAPYSCLSSVPTHPARSHLETERHIHSPQPQQFPYGQGVFCSPCSH